MIAEAISTVALAVGGWAAVQILKVPSLEEKVDHLVERVDSLYDHFLGEGPGTRRGDSK